MEVDYLLGGAHYLGMGIDFHAPYRGVLAAWLIRDLVPIPASRTEQRTTTMSPGVTFSDSTPPENEIIRGARRHHFSFFTARRALQKTAAMARNGKFLRLITRTLAL